MRIERAIELMYGSGWVRLEEARRASSGLALFFGVYKGRRGRRMDDWSIECSQVQEARITAWDGGGIGVYPSDHPVARQYTAREAEVRWIGTKDEVSIVGALYRAHREAVDDRIDFGTYADIRPKTKNTCACRGPEFLMRAYAKAIRSMGKRPHIILRLRPEKAKRLKVLQFGESYVVASAFVGKRREFPPQ